MLAGAGTLALEIEEDAPDADAVIVPVGGGGLISGVVAALGKNGPIRVIPVEAETSQALHAAIAAGEPVRVEPTSIADGLNVPVIGRPALEDCRDLDTVLVTEEEIEHAFRFLYERAKLACEPSGAVATAAILAGKVDAKRPVAIVTGGNVAAHTASGILDFR